VTVLMALLLTMPVASGFPSLTRTQQSVYFLAFMSTTLAVIFLLGEAAYHRLRGKPYDKGRLVKTAGRQMATALVLLAAALGSVTFLITELIFGAVASIPVTIVVLIIMTVAWFGLPLWRRIGSESLDPSQTSMELPGWWR
jgi:fatty acid desaturase